MWATLAFNGLNVKVKKVYNKKYFVDASYRFAHVNYHFAGENWEKPILRQHFLAEAKKSELQGLY